jgi:hypothetical protein
MVNRVLQFVSRESSRFQARHALPANSTLSRSLGLLVVSLLASLALCGFASGQTTAVVARSPEPSAGERETRLYATGGAPDTLSATETTASKRRSVRKGEGVVPADLVSKFAAPLIPEPLTSDSPCTA